MSTQLEKAQAFYALHQRPGVFVLPNPWDAGSAKLLAHVGFEALATTSLGFASTFGKVDGTGAVSRADTLANCRDIAAATDLPVNADLENCFADDPKTAAETIRLAAETGVVGGSIEDATGDAGKPIYDFDFAVERVRAAVAVARALPFPFTLTARAENFLHGRPDLDDTIRRLQAFAQAGADVLYAPGLKDLATIRHVVASVTKPVNVLMASPRSRTVSLGSADAISTGSGLARLALGAFLKGARALKDQGSFAWIGDAVPSRELKDVFGR